MSKRSKRYQKAAELVEEDKQYSLEDAVGLIKKFPAPKFD
ncbi:MAG: 50S ribosomal protein L1, partial [Akkermansiaceae bacterium]|nr:50S ribosomal protein L1 [Akkermansiaceae bacterium]